MSIFDYKPRIEYVTDPINTVDNIARESRPSAEINEPYVQQRGSIAIESLEDNLQKVVEIRSIIDERLRKVVVPASANLMDALIIDLVSSRQDASKLINEGIITYQLYKDCMGNELLSPILHAWEDYHAGVDGMVEAELLPYIITIQDDIASVIDIVNKTVTYDKDTQNMEALKQQELQELETFAKLTNDIYKLYRKDNVDIEALNIMRKQKDAMEVKLDVRKRIVHVAKEFSVDIGEAIDEVDFLISQDRQRAYYDSQQSQIEQISRQLGPDEASQKKVKLMVYQGFRKQRDLLLAKKQEFEVTFNPNQKRSAYRNIITDVRVALDVARPMLNDLHYTPMDSSVIESLMHIINGAEDAVMKEQYSVLEMKNILKSTVKNVKGHIKNISDKHKTRVMYKSL